MMAKLTDDERKLLDELTARASEPDADDDFEIEVYDTSAGKGARMPFSRAASWLHANLGIGEAPAPDSAAGEPPAAKPGTPAGETPGTPGTPGYFGRRAG
jgi:hypothetical protein